MVERRNVGLCFTATFYRSGGPIVYRRSRLEPRDVCTRTMQLRRFPCYTNAFSATSRDACLREILLLPLIMSHCALCGTAMRSASVISYVIDIHIRKHKVDDMKLSRGSQFSYVSHVQHFVVLAAEYNFVCLLKAADCGRKSIFAIKACKRK